MKQQTISDVEYSARKRKTKREEFLEIMDERQTIPTHLDWRRNAWSKRIRFSSSPI